jgi:hypothetical protein
MIRLKFYLELVHKRFYREYQISLQVSISSWFTRVFLVQGSADSVVLSSSRWIETPPAMSSKIILTHSDSAK